MDEQPTTATAGHGVSGAADTWPMSARDAARWLGVNERTVRRAIARGDLPATLHSGVYRIAPDDLRHFRRQQSRSTLTAKRQPRYPPSLISLPTPTKAAGAALSHPLTPLVGREREMATIMALLADQDVRLVTLSGPGGVGKTRLAQAVAAVWPEGRTRFVSLASVADPALVTSTLAQALGVREARGEQLIDRIAAALQDEPPLVIIDNFEHLLSATPIVAELLRSAPRLKVLVTSRARLRLSGEREHLVPPLDIVISTQLAPATPASRSEAVRLFAARVCDVVADFELTATNSDTVAAICHRLDGLPLAIELAAARTKVLPLPVLLARLERRLPLLIGGGRDLPARQQTMRDTIAWSYDLLSSDEQRLFKRLSVFTGGFTLEAAEAVAEEDRCSTRHPPAAIVDQQPSVLDGITALLDQSLLRRAADIAPVAGDSEARFQMLETVREYAWELLLASGEAERVCEHHAVFFAARAESLGRYLQWQRDTNTSLRLLDADRDNLRAAISWASAQGTVTNFLRITAALQHYWSLTGQTAEGRAWLDRAMDDSEAAPLSLRAAVMREAGWFARQHGELDRADTLGTQALALSREDGDATGIAYALIALGYVAEFKGSFSRARMFHEEAIALCRHLPDRSWFAWSMRNVGMQAFYLGEIEEAELWLNESIALFRQERLRFGAAYAMADLAEIALTRGDLARAIGLWQAWIDQLSGSALRLTHFLKGLARIASAAGQWRMAARLLGAAEVHRERLGVVLWPKDAAGYALMVTDLRTAIGEDAFIAAWTEGRRFSADEARSEAERVVDALVAVVEQKHPDGRDDQRLTNREFEVLRLLAAGYTNRQIAAILSISAKTVSNHVSRILMKLAVEGRAAAAALAVRRGLV